MKRLPNKDVVKMTNVPKDELSKRLLQFLSLNINILSDNDKKDLIRIIEFAVLKTKPFNIPEQHTDF